MEATYDSPAHDPVFFFLAHGRHRKRNILFKYARWSSLPRTNPGNRIRYTRQNGPYTPTRHEDRDRELFALPPNPDPLKKPALRAPLHAEGYTSPRAL